jgi:hypothetical protein
MIGDVVFLAAERTTSGLSHHSLGRRRRFYCGGRASTLREQQTRSNQTAEFWVVYKYYQFQSAREWFWRSSFAL